MAEIEPNCLLDTNVIINALRCKSQSVTDERALACDSLLAQLSEVRISSLTFFELFRKVLPEEQDTLDALRSRFVIYDLDAAVASQAARLVEQLQPARWNEPICIKCRAPLSANVCQTCNRMVSWKTNWSDYLLAATAIVQQLPVFYTADDELINRFERAHVLPSFSIRRPPDRSGALFEHARERRRDDGSREPGP